MRSMAVAAVGLLVLTLVDGTSVQAQTSHTELRVLPRAGILYTTGALGSIPDRQYEMRAELQGGFVAGLAVLVTPSSFPFGLRAGIDYLAGSEVSATTADCPESFRLCGWTMDADLLVATADLVLPLLAGQSALQPYALLGGGLKRYNIEAVPCMPAVRDDIPSCFIANEFAGTHNDLALHAGLGTDLRLGRTSLTGEIASTTSWFRPEQPALAAEEFGGRDSQIQHDLSAVIGVRILVF